MAVIHFVASLTVPPGTTASAPAEQELVTAPGIARLLRLYVPPGPRGEVSLYLMHQQRRVAPVPPATWDNLDDDVVDYPLDLALPVAETRFALVGCAPNANFEHTVTFEIHVDTTQAIAIATTSPQTLLARLAGLFG